MLRVKDFNAVFLVIFLQLAQMCRCEFENAVVKGAFYVFSP